MADRVVVISLTTTRKGPLVSYLESVIARGGSAVLIVGARGPWEPLPHEVTVVELLGLEERMLWYRLLRFIVVRMRARPLQVHERLVRRAGAVVPGPRGAALADRAREIRGALKALGDPSKAVSSALGSPLMRVARPWLFWRTVRRHALDAVAPAEITELVWGDQGSWPIAWHLARRSSATVRPFFEL